MNSSWLGATGLSKETYATKLEGMNRYMHEVYPGNFKVLWDTEGFYGINVVFDSEEDKTMWIMRHIK